MLQQPGPGWHAQWLSQQQLLQHSITEAASAWHEPLTDSSIQEESTLEEVLQHPQDSHEEALPTAALCQIRQEV